LSEGARLAAVGVALGIGGGFGLTRPGSVQSR
jgi:hypothetical protein